MADALIEYGEGVVISSTSSTVPNFIPMTRWIPAINVLQVRSTIEMRGPTANGVSLGDGFQTSNDMITVDAPASIQNSSFLRVEGFQYPSGYSDISASTAGRRYIRFGLMCYPGGNGAIQSCWAAIAVEILTQYANLVSSAGRITAPGAVTNYVGAETYSTTGTGDIGSGCNFAKNFPSSPSFISVQSQNNNAINNTALTWNMQVSGVGIYHLVTATGLVYFYETVTVG